MQGERVSTQQEKDRADLAEVGEHDPPSAAPPVYIYPLYSPSHTCPLSYIHPSPLMHPLPHIPSPPFTHSYISFYTSGVARECPGATIGRCQRARFPDERTRQGDPPSPNVHLTVFNMYRISLLYRSNCYDHIILIVLLYPSNRCFPLTQLPRPSRYITSIYFYLFIIILS